MANSRIGQYQIEYNLEGFTAPTRSHKLRLWVNVQGTPAVGAAPSAIDIMKRGGATATLASVADQAWSYFRLMYATTISATSYSLWKFATQNSRDFISAGTPASPAGATGSVQPAQQVTLTFRHALGGIGKLVFMECNQTGNSRGSLVANAGGTAPQRVAAYIMSADGAMIGLDNSFPVTPLRDARGENEAMFRLLYRS